MKKNDAEEFEMRLIVLRAALGVTADSVNGYVQEVCTRIMKEGNVSFSLACDLYNALMKEGCVQVQGYAEGEFKDLSEVAESTSVSVCLVDHEITNDVIQEIKMIGIVAMKFGGIPEDMDRYGRFLLESIRVLEEFSPRNLLRKYKDS